MDTRTISLIEKLREMRVERGCTPSEADAAALKIGRMVQEHGLPVAPAPAAPPPHSSPPPRYSARNPYRYEEEPFDAGDAACLYATEKAIYVQLTMINESVWIPKSVCRDGCEHWSKGDTGTLYVAPWFARKEGWNDYD